MLMEYNTFVSSLREVKGQLKGIAMQVTSTVFDWDHQCDVTANVLSTVF